MIGAINFAIAAAVNRSAGAAETGEIVRTTGQRVESGFWTTLNEVLLKIPNLLGFALAILAAWFVGRLMARALRRRLERRDKADLAVSLRRSWSG